MGLTITYLAGGRGWLDAGAAESISRIDSQLGHLLQITDAGRTWDQQYQNWLAYQNGTGSFALHPDTPSVHQLGNAIDSNEAQNILSRMDANGWVRTALGSGEVWHFEYFADRDQYLGSGGGDSSSTWNRTNRSTADIQRAVGADPDGEWGPETDSKIRAFQTYWGLDVDGIWGPASDAVAFLTADGDWGPATSRRVQAAFGVPIDGDPGPITWSAIQKYLGVAVDGDPGPQTYKALQRALKVNADGIFGYDSTVALQNWLLSGSALVPVPDPGDTSSSTPGSSTPNPAPTRTADDARIPGTFTGQWSANCEKRTGNAGSYFVIHGAADPRDAATQLQRFMNPNDRDVSCTWFVDGKTAYKVVHPDDRQWTTGRTIDQQALTVETRNTSGDPTWGISDDSHETIAQLVAWWAKNRGGIVDRQHVLGHAEARAKLDMSIPATACPGPSMDIDRIVKRALELLAPTPVDPKPPVDPEPNAGNKQTLLDIASTLVAASDALKKIAG